MGFYWGGGWGGDGLECFEVQRDGQGRWDEGRRTRVLQPDLSLEDQKDCTSIFLTKFCQMQRCIREGRSDKKIDLMIAKGAGDEDEPIQGCCLKCCCSGFQRIS